MTEHVWIFGDSFAEKWIDPEVAGKPAWPIMLEQKFYVENFAKCGSGPDYQLDILFNKLTDPDINLNKLKDTNLIFILSHNARIDFSFLTEPSHQVYIGKLTNDNRKTWNDHDIDIQKIFLSYEKYSDFVTDFYKFYYFHKNYEIDVFKRISFLKDITPLFKKVLVVPVFDDIEKFRLYKLLHKRSIIENFYIAQGDGIGWFSSSNPTDANHFTQENHYEFYFMLKNWIEKNTDIHTKRLKKTT